MTTPQLQRFRFKCNAEDPRPVSWPIQHPYWVSGYSIGHQERAIVVAYGEDEAYIRSNWPDAEEIEGEAVEGYTFTSRFPKPDWWKS